MHRFPFDVAGLVLALAAGGAGAVTPFRDLHDFDGLAGGDVPRDDLTLDAQGRVVGVAVEGGDWSGGLIYRLTLPTTPTGPVGYEVLHSFGPGEGRFPEGGVLIGSDGLYYGTTDEGGVQNEYGTVWRFDPKKKVLTTLHRFDPTSTPRDGSNPIAGLTAGPNGLLYGTTASNGPLGYGTVFAISPQGDGVHYETLHAFGAAGDGASPNRGRLVSRGNALYGVTNFGGTFNGYGTAYRMLLSGGTWTESLMFIFANGTGTAFLPSDGLVIDKAGNLYGCSAGGHSGRGVVYKLSPGGSGPWPYTEIADFGADVDAPSAGECWLELDAGGRLVGTSSGGGTAGRGTVFTTSTSGAPIVVKQSFGIAGNGGYSPSSPVLAVGGGYYVGTTSFGGPADAGTLYGLKP